MGIGLLNNGKRSWLSRCLAGSLIVGLFLTGGLLQPQQASAQLFEEDTESLPPLVIINAAGVDRLLGDVNYMFKTIGREDLSVMGNGFLGNIDDLKGLDRKKSMGVMLYFKPGLPPSVDPVGYVPVDNIGDLLKTIQLGPVKTKKVPGEDNRYEIEAPRQTMHVVLQGGYAYVSNSVDAIDRELPNPGLLTESLTQRYDLAASVNIAGIPEGMRTIFLDFLRAQTEAQLQQRDNEPEFAYRARKAGGMNNLKNIEAIIQDGQSLTLGIDASQEARAIVVELEVKAKASSEFAKELKKFPGKPTVFANAYSEQIPMAMTGSWNLAEKDKEVFQEFVKALDLGVTEGMQRQNLDPAGLKGVIKSLESTVNSGSVDFFLQFVGEPPGKFSLVGGLKVDRANDFATGLQTLFQEFSKDPNIAEMQLNAETHNGVGLHRILGKGEGGRGERNLYGGMPAVYVGAGRGAVWFGLGKEGTADQLKRAMTLVETVPVQPLTPDQIAPFQLVLNLSSWIALSGNEEPQNFPVGPPPENEQEAARQEARRARFAQERQARMEAAREAFKPDNDRLLITSRPVPNGFRFKLQFDEGFIKFLGLRLSNQLDKSQL